MDSLATYRTYREVARELIDKVMKASLSRDMLDRAAKLLGMSRGGVLVFDSEEETSVLFDFALNDVRAEQKNAIELYGESGAPTNEIEKDVLAAFASAHTSLFNIVSVSKSDRTVRLRDLLNKGDDITITDINLSSMAVPGFLLFVRLLRLGNLNFASGIMFVFPGHLERRLLAEYKQAMKKASSLSLAQKRFVYFFKAHRAYGLDVRFE